MKPITTEEIILVPCLFVGWAIATIARDVAAPLAALVLTLLGWRPKPPLAYVMNCGSGKTRPTWDPALVPKSLQIAITCQPRTFSSRDVLQPLSLPQLRTMAELRGLDPVGLSRKGLIEALLDNAVDRANDYSAEVPTAAERSPSLRRRRP